jgi:hypothetical protein
LGAQEESGFLLDPITAAQCREGLINLPGFASLPGRKKSSDGGIQTSHRQRIQDLAPYKHF